MRPDSVRALRLGLLLFLAICAQSAFADSLRIRSVPPDVPLVVAIIGSMYYDADRGAFLGFIIGVFHAAFATPSAGGFTALILSRLLVCFGVGWLEERIFRDSLPLALGMVALGSMLVECLFFVIAPQPDIPHWIRQTLFATLYNTLLTLPLYFVIRRSVASARDAVDSLSF